MEERGPFPSKDADFNDYVNIVIPYLNVNFNKNRLVTASAALAMLSQITLLYGLPPPTPPLINWIAIYPLNQNPATRTDTTIAEQATLRTQLEEGLRFIYADAPNSALTPIDRSTLHLPARDTTPTHAPIADHAPNMALDKATHSLITIRITDPANPHTQAMPAGQHVHANAGFKPTPTAQIIWDANRFYEVHRFLVTVPFTEDDKAKEVFFRSRYVNTRGEPGPWSDTISTIVT